jgi:hypothetical protein
MKELCRKVLSPPALVPLMMTSVAVLLKLKSLSSS